MILIEKKLIKKIDINKILEHGRNRGSLKMDLLNKNYIYKEVNWIINNDNMVSHFGYNFYIRTKKACDKNYQVKSVGIAYRAIKNTLKNNGFEILAVYFDGENLKDILI